ncbi:alpha/beta hydrolase [Fulvimonas sp. R45]|nr:alpha/beta hydrolase [Fulvimonas sp. R45]
MHQGRWWSVPCAAAAMLALSGCVGFVARQIEHPGRSSQKSLAPFRQMLEEAGFRYDAMRTRQGVRIAYWYGQPRDYGVTQVASERREGGHVAFHVTFHFKAQAAAAPLPARGSIVLLHPWGAEGSAMAGWGLAFAGAGYVVAMPDLRSQGRSDDAPVGYGPREAGDIVDLVHHLEAAHRLPRPWYLLGASYGATVALFAAPQLQVRGVIALEPYADAVDAIHRAPASGLFGHRWLARWISRRELDKAVARAGRALGVDLARIDPGAALADASACTLVLGGGHDTLIPPAALRDLARRSPRARFVEVPGEGHLTLPMRTDRLFTPLLAWMDALPADPGGDCPAFAGGDSAPAASSGHDGRNVLKRQPQQP